MLVAAALHRPADRVLDLASFNSGFQSISLIVMPSSVSMSTVSSPDLADRHNAVELQIFADCPAAGEQVVGRIDIFKTIPAPRIGPL